MLEVCLPRGQEDVAARLAFAYIDPAAAVGSAALFIRQALGAVAPQIQVELLPSSRGAMLLRFVVEQDRELVRNLSPIEHNGATLRPVRLAYQTPASSTFLSEQTSHQQPANSNFLSEQISTSHQPPAKRTGCWCSSVRRRRPTVSSVSGIGLRTLLFRTTPPNIGMRLTSATTSEGFVSS
jgi:hypothetical protein